MRGKGYNEFYLAEGRHPDRRDLDAAAPLHPVKLTHRSGHAHVLNSLALKQAGITAETAILLRDSSTANSGRENPRDFSMAWGNIFGENTIRR